MGVTINKKPTTTEPSPKNGHQPKPQKGLNAFYWYQIFALDSAVVEVQEMFSSHGGHLTKSNVSSWTKDLRSLNENEQMCYISFNTCLIRIFLVLNIDQLVSKTSAYDFFSFAHFYVVIVVSLFLACCLHFLYRNRQDSGFSQ